MDRRLALDHAARLVGLRIRLGVALDDVDVRHDDLVAHDAHHVALLALVLAGGDDHAVTLLDTVHIVLSSIRGSVASPSLYLPMPLRALQVRRSEEHTSELQSLMRISYAVFCLKKKNKKYT